MFLSTVFLGVIMATFTLNSPNLQKRGLIAKEYTCMGDDMSPELNWQGAPSQTKSFAITCVDPDAPGGLFIHWTIYNIPSSLNHLAADTDKEPILSRGILQGMNHFGNVGYGGPCPPPSETHSYIFTIYALDTLLDLPPKASYEELQNAMQGHILKEARLSSHFTK